MTIYSILLEMGPQTNANSNNHDKDDGLSKTRLEVMMLAAEDGANSNNILQVEEQFELLRLKFENTSGAKEK